MLIEAEDAELKIVLVVVGGCAGLGSNVRGGAVLRGGDGNVVGITGVVSAVVVVEGRDRGEDVGIESVQPGEEDAGIDLGLTVAKIEAGEESSELPVDQVVFDVVGIRIVRNLVVVAAGGSRLRISRFSSFRRSWLAGSRL